MASYTNVLEGLIGLCIGDALGVPVEFTSREKLKLNPVVDMIGFGTFDQPPGTWSDDSSLVFCLAESLCDSYNLQDIADKFIRWYEEGYWTAHGEVFDIGNSTLQAIDRIKLGSKPECAGGKTAFDNGNGSLMRILPLAFYLLRIDNIVERFRVVKDISSITHAHIRSIMACFFYIELALELLKGKSFDEAVKTAIYTFDSNFSDNTEKIHFERILNGSIAQLSENDIFSSGYVIHSLEACLWCIYNSKSYKEAVLRAVNLGEDTDTIAAITGGLAGIIFGYESIPLNWINNLASKDDIINLCKKFYNKVIAK